MRKIDLNCDMGEGIGNEASIMPFISSANIACGYHAGDIETIIKTILLASEHKVSIGAHPSFPDRENFGRIEMKIAGEDLYEIVSVQIGFMAEICIAAGLALRHVKPHGALYNMSAKDADIATTIAKAVRDIDKNLVLFGLSGSHSITAAREAGLQTASEVFADRTYRDDGSLTPRADVDAMINDPGSAVKQVMQMINEGSVTTVSGSIIPVTAETICIHGDGEHAIEIAKAIYQALKNENIAVSAIT